MRIVNLLNIIGTIAVLNACQFGSSNRNPNLMDSTESQIINLVNRDSFVLPSALDEISGHTFVSGNNDLVYCIQDEEGNIYAYNLKSNTIEKVISFAKNGDYEGITNDGKFFYILKSNGSIYSFPIGGNSSQVKEFKNLLGKGEYESLGIDTLKKELVVLCKSCKSDRKKDYTTGYVLNYASDGNVSLSRDFVIRHEDVVEIDDKFPKVFNPSAITKRVSTGEWYILSSIDKLILVTDSNFNPLSVIPFSRKDYEQPEGIAFDGNDNLYISSERGENSSGVLYKIK